MKSSFYPVNQIIYGIFINNFILLIKSREKRILFSRACTIVGITTHWRITLFILLSLSLSLSLSLFTFVFHQFAEESMKHGDSSGKQLI
jgi:hypothetical protein